jgi:hypothetical protein
MSPTVYKLLGYLVVKGAKWYLRERLPRLRSLAIKGLLVGGALTAVAVLARRASG